MASSSRILTTKDLGRNLCTAVWHAVQQDTDMVIVSKDKQLLPCHSSLLALFSPVVAQLLSDVPCRVAPTIFLPDFQAMPIRKLLHILGSGQAVPGETADTDIKNIIMIAKVLQIAITDLSVGPYLDNPLGVDVKQEMQSVKTCDVKEEIDSVNVKQEEKSVKIELMEEHEYIEKDITDSQSIVHEEGHQSSILDQDPQPPISAVSNPNGFGNSVNRDTPSELGKGVPRNQGILIGSPMSSEELYQRKVHGMVQDYANKTNANVRTGFEEKIEDRRLGCSSVVAWRGGKKLGIGGDNIALICETYTDDVSSPVKETGESPKKIVPKGFNEFGRPCNGPMEISLGPFPINPVLVKAANNAAGRIMGPARAKGGGDASPKLMCSLCKEDGPVLDTYFSAYKLLSHVFLGHRKKIVSRSRKNHGMMLACPEGCGFVTGRSSAGVSIEYYNGQLPLHLYQLTEHIRGLHTREERLGSCQVCQFPLEHREAWSWHHLANHTDKRRRYCQACNTFPFLNEAHKCTGKNKHNQLPPPVSGMGEQMPSQIKANSKFGK